MISICLRRLLVISLVLLLFCKLSSAQQVRRPRPHYPKFEILWPLHWVSAAYVWGFLKMGFIYAGLMLLLVFRGISSWKSEPTFIDHGAPVYSYRGFRSGGQADVMVYWNDKIDKIAENFREA